MEEIEWITMRSAEKNDNPVRRARKSMRKGRGQKEI